MGERTSVHSRFSGPRHGGLGGADGVDAALGAGGAVVEVLARDGLGGRQRLRSIEVPGRQGGGAAGLGQLRLGAGQLGPVGTGIDLEEQLALADLLPLDEGDPLDVARHARPDLHRLDRLQAADELVPLGDPFALPPRPRSPAGGGGAEAGWAARQPASEARAPARAMTFERFMVRSLLLRLPPLQPGAPDRRRW
jgi:hypothetical protein